MKLMLGIAQADVLYDELYFGYYAVSEACAGSVSSVKHSQDNCGKVLQPAHDTITHWHRPWNWALRNATPEDKTALLSWATCISVLYDAILPHDRLARNSVFPGTTKRLSVFQTGAKEALMQCHHEFSRSSPGVFFAFKIAIGHFTRKFPGLCMHHRLAILVPEDNCLESFREPMTRALQQSCVVTVD